MFMDDLIRMLVSLAQREGQHSAYSANDLLSGRSEMWPLGLSLFQEQPILGYGLGASQGLIEANSWLFVESQGSHFHNSYLTVLVETGIVGFLVFAALIAVALINGFVKVQGAIRRTSEHWAALALPWVIVAGALGHALFETWLLSAGNANAPILWTCIWLLLRGGLRRRTAPGVQYGAFSWERRRFQDPRRML
jgi:O-antigen ligase